MLLNCFSSFNPLESTFSYNISEIEVQVEIFDDEIETIKEYFNDRKITISRMSHIFQNILPPCIGDSCVLMLHYIRFEATNENVDTFSQDLLSSLQILL